MLTRLLQFVAVLAALVVLTPGACAQDATDEGPPAPAWMRFDRIVEIPDTPAGAQARWIIGVLRGDDPGDLAARLSDSMKQQATPEGFLDFVGQAREALGWPYPTHIIESHEHALTIYLQTMADEMRWVLQTRSNPDDPALLDGVVLQPAPAPEIDRMASWDELAARLDATGCETGVMIVELKPDGSTETVFARNQTRPMNISGASSVFVLGATARKISDMLAQGNAPNGNPWDEIIPFDPSIRGVPDAPLSQAPIGSQIPVATYALHMLQGDDSATEHLIRWTGREAIEDFLAKIAVDTPDTRPYLTTRQAMALKLSFDEPLRERYQQSDEATRLSIAESLRIPDAGQLKLWIKPQGIDKVGYFASARDLASAMNYLRGASALEGMDPLRRVLGANQSVRLDSGYWRSVAFAGGAEPGVLTTCFLVERNDGRWFIASAIFNDADEPLSGHVTSPVLLGMLDLLQRQ